MTSTNHLALLPNGETAQKRSTRPLRWALTVRVTFVGNDTERVGPWHVRSWSQHRQPLQRRSKGIVDRLIATLGPTVRQVETKLVPVLPIWPARPLTRQQEWEQLAQEALDAHAARSARV